METDGNVAEAPKQRARRVAVIATAAASLVLIAFAAVYVDSRVKATEMEGLLAATTTSESIMLSFKDSYADLQTEYERQSEFCSEASCWDYVINEWRTAQKGEAQRHLIRLQEAFLDVEAVSPLPWHGDIATSRDAYLEHMDAWLDRLDYESTFEIADYSEGRSASLSNEISRTWVVAERRYRDVSIVLEPDYIAAQIDAIFSE